MFFALPVLYLATQLVAVDAALLLGTSTVVGKSYDFIVVGAGAVGPLLANRLSEDGTRKVLLVEAGPNDADYPNIAIPLLAAGQTTGEPFTFNYTSVPQSTLGGRSIQQPRGRVLAGSTSTNFMFMHKGTASEWDRLASLTGDLGWSWSSMKNNGYFNKWEKIVAPRDQHSLTGQYLPSAHGTTGPIQITIANYKYSTDDVVKKAATQKGMPFNLDISSGGSALGLGYITSATGGGVRQSSAIAYLHSNNVMNRANLDVLVGYTVTKLSFAANTTTPTVNGVYLSSGKGAVIQLASATKEVLLCAGAFGTPQILLLSGIGDAKQLSSFGIKQVVELPIGQNLQDHPILPTNHYVNSTDTFDTITESTTLTNNAVATWQANHTGPFSDFGANVVGWDRIPSDDPIFKTYADPSSGSLSPHTEVLYGGGWYNPLEARPDTGNFIGLTTALITPASRGTVKLASTDPFAAPLIDPAYYSSPLDRYIMKQQLKKNADFLSAAAFKGYYLRPAGATAKLDVTSDASLDAYINSQTTTIFHPSSTVPMRKDSAGALNSDLTVKGVKNLRVADLSSFPYIPAGHPTAFLYSLGERAADLIKAAHA